MAHPTRLNCFRIARTLGLAFAALTFVASSAWGQESPHARWETKIAQFEKADKAEAPPKNEVLFVGSSSILRWDLKKYFPDQSYINRGFGGSEIADSTYFADRIIIPCKPKTVILYAGDNDIAKGKTAEQVAKDFQAFVERVQTDLPKTRIGFIAIKPSISRWKLVTKMRKANQLIEKLIQENSLLFYIDIDTPMIGSDGKPEKELFASDGLHLSHEGYLRWVSVIKPLLQSAE